MYSSSREVQQPRYIFAYLLEADLELTVSGDSSQSRETSTVVDEALRPVVPGGSTDISCPNLMWESQEWEGRVVEALRLFQGF
jgi:hypothetical protein